jgi:putative ABC transport system permease protein
MRFIDLFWLAVTALWQRPLRTALTTLGVLIGTFVLVTTLAISEGVQSVIFDQLRKQDQLRRVFVWQSGGVQEQHIPRAELEVPGDMSAARRARLREAIVRRWRRPAAPMARTGLSPEDIDRLKTVPHVTSVTPGLSWSGLAILDRQSQTGMIVTASPDDRGLPRRLVAGRFFEPGETEGVLVSEYLAYRWGMKDESEVNSLLGKSARLEIRQGRMPGAMQLLSLLNVAGQELTAEQRRVLERLVGKVPEALAKMEMTDEERKVLTGLLMGAGRERPLLVEEQPIVGVFRDVERYELGPWDGPIRGVDVWVPPEVSRRMYLAQSGRGADLPTVTVRVDDEKNLKEVHKAIASMGMEAFSLAEVVDQVRVYTLLISIGCTLVALVALTVASLGITNTMLMSVLQRTHEIGVMKAVGARDSQVLLMFLLEGALVGVLGAGLGLVGSVLASYPGDQFARYLIEKQTPMRLEMSVFEYPAWLLIVVPTGVVLWTTLAAVSPARRAARIDPIEALRQR